MSRLSILTGPSLALAAALVAVAACSAKEPSAVSPDLEDDEILAAPGDGAEAAGKPDLSSVAHAEGTIADASAAVADATAAPTPVAQPAGPARSQDRIELEEEAGGEAPAAATEVTSTRGRVARKSERAETRGSGRRREVGILGGASAMAVDDLDAGGSVGAGAVAASSPKARPFPPEVAADYAPAAEPVSAPPPADPITMYGSSETYTDHGVNPFTMVADDALSTFSIDVDTASFAIARKKIEAGVLPPPEAVRVEEFVNYLDYGYQAPTDGSPFAVHMDAMPDPFRSGHHVLRVGVQAREVSRDERPPLHLTFLVDVSGSMSSPDKLGLAKKSLHMLVDSLREDDTVALATYAGRTATVLDPTTATDKWSIHQAIEGLSSGGSTAMSSGLDLAYGMAWDSFEPGHENRVIVLSDGDANVGRTSWDDMLSQIKGYADRGVTMSTIGFGMGNYQDTLMEQLSNKGDGNNYYIDDADQARRVFVEELGGTLVTVARDTKIQVQFNPDSVLAYRLIGYENRDIADKDFRNDKVDAGEVGSGHNVTALYDVILAEGYERSLATVRLRYEQPGADVDHGGSGGIERAWTFRDRDLAERPDFAARDLRIAYTSATFAEILRQSPEAQELSLDALIAFGDRSKRRGETDDVELLDLMRRARDLGAGTSSGAVSVR